MLGSSNTWLWTPQKIKVWLVSMAQFAPAGRCCNPSQATTIEALSTLIYTTLTFVYISLKTVAFSSVFQKSKIIVLHVQDKNAVSDEMSLKWSQKYHNYKFRAHKGPNKIIYKWETRKHRWYTSCWPVTECR